ncbi:MAG: YjjG family noncanonical pyrimidine nucleotidase [Anaeromicrobium sp.]|jgi:putative hydrolase of the HAD superfamily|uniref:YjjG family noncanonical pyrimidine nucleotidase n=1 Tax=Anaeromicrobium sp. TaxID=1929132 RepID=UPI0025E6AACB|nr:YjjG family noncanonical pyrimidine nucleotidase [Anaeromicrobium sp.]MCT4596210.1 YjjG family noncanonical pyrimidine nucleotidase [Anaeromicrobium sp.]
MKYKVILFDADETLFDFKKTEEYAFERTIKEFNINYDREYHFKTYKIINKNIWNELEKGLIGPKKLKVERFNRLKQKLNLSFCPEDFSCKYGEFLGEGSFVFEDAPNIVNELSKKYRLGIITNGLAKVQNNRIRNSSIYKYFDNLIISEEVNVSKPNPEIFKISLNDLNHEDKSSVLIVGDSLTSDIKGGINFDIDTCWYNPNKIENTTDMKPTYEINNLMDLLNII